MALSSGLDTLAKKIGVKKPPRLLTVVRAWHLTPHMIRVVFAGPELDGFPSGRDGGNCKLMLPEADEPKTAFATRLIEGPPPVRRTYTVRQYDETAGELTIDFVDHGDGGPASRWARAAEPGSFLGFAGPSGPKVTHFEADWYLVAADPSALPLAAVTLEALPEDAQGIALFEVPSLEDKQPINAPPGVKIHWLVQADAQVPSTAQEAFFRSLDWPDGRIQTCIAGEASVIKALRQFLLVEKGLAKQDAYISGYWKIGLVEDEHQAMKRQED